MHSNALAFASIISVVLFAISCSKSSLAAAQISSTDQEFLTAHNSARAAVGVGPVSWDDTVSAYAENYANQRISGCMLIYSGGLYGENIFLGSGREYTPTDAVNAWVWEKQYYDYDTNTCVAGMNCSHYTQVVWEATVRIGCTRAKCDSGAVLIICNYSPAGNVAGQRPYQAGLVFTNWGWIEVHAVIIEPFSSTWSLVSFVGLWLFSFVSI